MLEQFSNKTRVMKHIGNVMRNRDHSRDAKKSSFCDDENNGEHAAKRDKHASFSV